MFVKFGLLLLCSVASPGFALSPNIIFALPTINLSVLTHPAVESQPPPSQQFKEIVDPQALIREAAQRHQVPTELVTSIVAAESNFNWDAVSPKGAIGLMQLMPETAKEYGADPTDPKQNVDAGTRYLRVLLDKYRKYRHSLVHVIAAYNAGPAMVDRYHGVPPFRETRQYVARVLRFLRSSKNGASVEAQLAGQRSGTGVSVRLFASK